MKNELRIGNLVIDKEDGNVYQIPSGLSIEKADLMTPIPLTEDWLVKFGFVYIKGHGWIVDNVFDFGLNDTFELDWYENAPLKHVHQLQNLYFTLTGKELTI